MWKIHHKYTNHLNIVKYKESKWKVFEKYLNFQIYLICIWDKSKYFSACQKCISVQIQILKKYLQIPICQIQILLDPSQLRILQWATNLCASFVLIITPLTYQLSKLRFSLQNVRAHSLYMYQTLYIYFFLSCHNSLK